MNEAGLWVFDSLRKVVLERRCGSNPTCCRGGAKEGSVIQTRLHILSVPNMTCSFKLTPPGLR